MRCASAIHPNPKAKVRFMLGVVPAHCDWSAIRKDKTIRGLNGRVEAVGSDSKSGVLVGGEVDGIVEEIALRCGIGVED